LHPFSGEAKEKANDLLKEMTLVEKIGQWSWALTTESINMERDRRAKTSDLFMRMVSVLSD